MTETMIDTQLGDGVACALHDDPFLLIATPRDPALARDPGAVARWFSANRDAIERSLVDHGAIRFRGFAIFSTADFAATIEDYPPLAGDYAGGASPRAKLAEKVFEATSAAADIPIYPHQEMSYLPRWPRKVAFYCHRAPDVGGETIAASVRRFEQGIDPEFFAAIRARGLLYTRNYRGPGAFPDGLTSIHRTWQSAFNTEDPNKAEADIAEMGMEHRWEGDGSLTALYHADGVTTHPLTGDCHWFNQLTTLTFTPESLPSRWSLYAEHYGDGRPKPYDIRYGDGEAIALDDIRALYPLLDAATVALPWQDGDVMMLDNILAMHGRNPFTGHRDVQVALLESGGV
jgi:alpha-ketoglutarate-dependent taurine dioxygenase